ncbi:MAG: hypothetical protein SF069_06795 [Phycisphaerae bacterium]|nr:hypothetical protein [Phycisphaerae bacterium]
MRVSSRTLSGAGILLLGAILLAAGRSVEKLDRAVQLYEQQKYSEAAQLLAEIDRASLSDAEKQELDRLAAAVQRTLDGAKKSQQDFTDAEAAFGQQRWATADALYSAVIENPNTPADLRDQAIGKRDSVRSKMASGQPTQRVSVTTAGPATPQGPVGEMVPVSSGSSTPPPAQPRPQPQPTMTTNRPAPQTARTNIYLEPMVPVTSASPSRPAPAPAPVVTRTATPAPVVSTGPMAPMNSAPPATLIAGSGRDAARAGTVDEMQARDELLWQRAVALLDNLSAKARNAMGEENFDEARRLASQALQEIEAAREYAEPADKYTSARERALALQDEVKSRAREYEIRTAGIQAEEIKTLIAERTAAIEAQKAEKIEQLFATGAELRREQKFNEEAEVYRQVLLIDATNARAKHYLELAEDYASYLQQQDWHAQLGFEQRRALTNADAALIPLDYDVVYPRNWAEIIARRDAIGPGVTGQSLGDIELNKRLEEVLPEISFAGQALEKVVDYLQENTSINISVDWDDLETNGIQKDDEITLRLAGLSLRTVMNEILTQAGGDVRLAFAVGEGLLRIATKEKLDRDKLILVYDIRDLLVNVPRFANAAQLDPAQALQNVGQQQGGFGAGGGAGGGGGGGGGGQGGQLFQGGGQQNQEDDFDAGALVERILDLIRQTVEPDSWRENGGEASIRELNGQLIIYNTSDSHRQVQDLLGQLRETRALQIAMESRFLNVTSNFLEEIGVDIDFVFNQGSAGFDRSFTGGGAPISDPFTGAPVLIPRTFSQIGTFASPPGFGTPFTPGLTPVQPYQQAAYVPTSTGIVPQLSDATPITAQQGSLGLVNPGNLNTGVPGSFAQSLAQPALNIAGSVLDNLQVDFLIRATQANARSSIVQSPRILMFNGQRANIIIGRARTFVGSLQPIVAENAVGFIPIIDVAPSGVTLDVEGTISADRKYVTTTIRTTQSEEPSLERFEVSRASGSSPGSFVTLRDQRFVSINTTASIPDGGTILIGGLKQVGEIEVEAGVPILSKIPILKRAFTNSTVVKDTRTLLILMKAKILIQKEQEEEAFPTFAGGTGG